MRNNFGADAVIYSALLIIAAFVSYGLTRIWLYARWRNADYSNYRSRRPDGLTDLMPSGICGGNDIIIPPPPVTIINKKWEFRCIGWYIMCVHYIIIYCIVGNIMFSGAFNSKCDRPIWLHVSYTCLYLSQKKKISFNQFRIIILYKHES